MGSRVRKLGRKFRATFLRSRVTVGIVGSSVRSWPLPEPDLGLELDGFWTSFLSTLL